jgi:hypothetical protein
VSIGVGEANEEEALARDERHSLVEEAVSVAE